MPPEPYCKAIASLRKKKQRNPFNLLNVANDSTFIKMYR